MELKALRDAGMIVEPLPVCAAAIRVWRVVRAVGWDGARDLVPATFRGWEVEFLGIALGMLADADRDAERQDQVGLLEALTRRAPRG